MDLDLDPLPMAASSESKRPLENRLSMEEICGLFPRAVNTGHSFLDRYDVARGWSEGQEKLWQRWQRSAKQNKQSWKRNYGETGNGDSTSTHWKTQPSHERPLQALKCRQTSRSWKKNETRPGKTRPALVGSHKARDCRNNHLTNPTTGCTYYNYAD